MQALMVSLEHFLTGWWALAAVLVAVAGLVLRTVWRVRVTSGKPGGDMRMATAFEVLSRVNPLNARGWKFMPLATGALLAMHYGMLLVLLFAGGHVVLATMRVGWEGVHMPLAATQTVAAVVLAGSLFLLVRRVRMTPLRRQTTRLLWVMHGLLAISLVTALAAPHAGVWLTQVHMVCGGLLFLSVPFSHAVTRLAGVFLTKKPKGAY